MGAPLKTSHNRWLTSIIAVVVLLVVATDFANCEVLDETPVSHKPTSSIASAFGLSIWSAQHQAELLMAMYDLHPSDSFPTEHQTKLEMSSPPFNSMASASKAIGYDLTKYAGKEVVLYRYRLKERFRSKEGDIDAVFVYCEGNIVGAYLVPPKGYIGGVLSLKQRRQFAPPASSK